MIKNITLSAEEKLIKKAREKAKKENTSLNAKFRKWLEEYTETKDRLKTFDRLMKKMSYADSGGKFTREEMNER